MAEELRERLVPVRVTKLCEVCGAPVRFNGAVLTSNPPQYRHWCTNDEFHPVRTFSCQYPRIEYEAITVEQPFRVE